MREHILAQTPTAAVGVVNPSGWNRPPGSPLLAPARPAPQPISRRAAILALFAAVLVVGSLFNETW